MQGSAVLPGVAGEGCAQGPCGRRCWAFRATGRTTFPPQSARRPGGRRSRGGAPVVLSGRKRLDCLARRNPATTNVISQRAGVRAEIRIRRSERVVEARQLRRRGVRRPAPAPGRPAAEPARGVRLRAAPLPGGVRRPHRDRGRDPNATSANTRPSAASAADTGSRERKKPRTRVMRIFPYDATLVRLASGPAIERNPDVDGAALPHHGRGTALRSRAGEDRLSPGGAERANDGQACA